MQKTTTIVSRNCDCTTTIGDSRCKKLLRSSLKEKKIGKIRHHETHLRRHGALDNSRSGDDGPLRRDVEIRESRDRRLGQGPSVGHRQQFERSAAASRRLNVGHRSSAGRAGGHFTLNGGLEPRNPDAGCHPDNCGFDVVSDQTGYPASLLRRIIVQRMLVRLYQSRLRGRDHRFQCSRCRRAFIMRVSRSTINSCNL
ncbi:unnamed protein product [Trichogramma brassicae]|uniref:Uncharacterized protein n=1 Tax=Trichogramma brassicae TaxID=86971 RepID=A0A6H5I136_9HYME|nr:unnamed protein product [Trichogramma brassicae]